MARFHIDADIRVGQDIDLPETVFRHAVQVLRMRKGASLTLFNGQGGEFSARLIEVGKKSALVRIEAFDPVERESCLALSLIQGISKGDRMDWALQKATELGVQTIVPLVTERCNVQLDSSRASKKWAHWQSVMISACEQSGRTRIPALMPVQPFADWIEHRQAACRMLLDPEGTIGVTEMDASATGYQILVGPEGGFSRTEVAMARANEIHIVRCGPRVLRTETAGLAVAAALQSRFGDL